MFINETQIKVRYVETDQMGIVHHSHYFAWFEVGRTELIRETGKGYSDVESMGVMIPLLEVNCKYYKGAKYEDILSIHTCISELRPTRIFFHYDIYRINDSIKLAEGSTQHVFVNKQFSPVNLIKANFEIWNLMSSLT